ncbi:winged helix-turn-helix domain-containing protein [Natrinema salaciae]|uniref:Citrate synthase n=1 Tax=Natrinema salaciae TaxID=1186196 RepID=A0A1H9NZR6_9EURY|nr:helix-turn-helix domain-containing protein [Natrinema salaciae]SER41069.1 citrate synthase [Natrinema salaciae]
MAIPGWIWPDNQYGDREVHHSPSVEGLEIEHATSVFEVLSNTTRLEILVALHERSGSLSYTKLREVVSVDDKGKFNYHLRKLEPLVCTQDGEYTLTNRGETFIQRIISEEIVLNRE